MVLGNMYKNSRVQDRLSTLNNTVLTFSYVQSNVTQKLGQL